MSRVSRIDVRWQAHPDAALVGQPGVMVPQLSARLSKAAAHYLAPAYLVPSAFFTVVPMPMALAIPGLVPHDLPPFADPLLPSLTLRRWAGRQPVQVFGGSLSHIELRLPVVIEVSGQLNAMLLGSGLFRLVRCHLDPDGGSYLAMLDAA